MYNGADAMSMLKLDDISLSFGGVNALSNVTLEIEKGTIHSLIGPNGAGKTSLLNCINKFYKPQKGRILFQEEDITRLKPHQIATRGIARTFQNIELFKGMTVLDNIKLGRHIYMKSGMFSASIYFGQARREEIRHRYFIEEKIIELLELEDIRKEIVGTLPYGFQKRIELARALAMEPQLLLLDEPTAGMNVEETQYLVRYILDIKDVWNVTMLLVEHDMRVVMGISDMISVLNFGQMIAQGVVKDIQKDPLVMEAYLGEEKGADFVLD